MDIDEFVEKYPQVDRKTIAQICHCSINTVNRWFMARDKRNPLSEDQKLWLEIFDFLYTRKAAEPKSFQELQEIIDNLQK